MPDAFFRLAAHFCQRVDSRQFTMADISACFAGLYFHGLSVIAQNSFTDAFDSPDISSDAFVSAHKKYSDIPKLPFAYYQCFSSPTDIESTPGIGDACDDIIDVYHDMKVALILWEMGCKSSSALYLRDMFCHWGEHATSFMHAFHTYTIDTPGERPIISPTMPLLYTTGQPRMSNIQLGMSKAE